MSNLQKIGKSLTNPRSFIPVIVSSFYVNYEVKY